MRRRLSACSNVRPLLYSRPDSSFTASDSRDANYYAPHLSRIQTDHDGGAWIASEIDTNPWLQVDLGEIYNIQQIEIKARNDVDQRVTSFKLALAGDNVDDMSMVRTQTGLERIFLGPQSQDDTATVSINRTDARFVRLYPLTFEEHRSVRWEVYACMEGLIHCIFIKKFI